MSDMGRDERLKKIVRLLSASGKPVSGGRIAKMMGVTRQVVVQDIAILKSRGYKIISTARGYMLENPDGSVKKLVAVRHSKEQVKEELSSIVEQGGEIIDVIVEHPIYGELRGSLGIKSYDDIERFMGLLHSSGAEPLSYLANGVHLHTIATDSEEKMERIVETLREKGFLIV